MRTQVRLVLLCVPLLLLAACGSSTAVDPSPTATQPAAPSPTTAIPSPTPTQQPTPTPAANFTVYTSSDQAYSISYPTDWQALTVDSDPGKVTFEGPDQEFIVSDNYGPSASDLQQAATAFCQGMASPSQPPPTSPVIGTTVELAGQSWFKAECSADTQPGRSLIIELTVYKGATYQIFYSSSSASFNADDTTFYEPMQQSFQFLT